MAGLKKPKEDQSPPVIVFNIDKDAIEKQKRVSKRLPRSVLTEQESHQLFMDLQLRLADSPSPFEDLGFNRETDDHTRWMRLEAVIEEIEKEEFSSVFVRPSHDLRRPMRFTCNGHGDGPCRVAAAANCLLEFPSLLGRILPHSRRTQRFDLLRYRLWSFGRWEDVYLDDELPFDNDGTQVILEMNDGIQLKEVSMPRAQYMKLGEPQRGVLEIWPLFLEKAIAKLLGSYGMLRALTFEAAISMLMGCEVLTRRISDDHARQVTALLRILTVMQRNTIVFLRQEIPSRLDDCSTSCMFHKTDDIFVVLAFKEMSDTVKVTTTKNAGKPGAESSLSSLQILNSVHLLIRRVSCKPLDGHMRCQMTPNEERKPRDGGVHFFAPDFEEKTSQNMTDMSKDSLFTEKGVFWESAAYILGHFSHTNMCFFPQEVPPTASEDLISLNMLPWYTSHAEGAWVRGKNSVISGNRSQQASCSPQYALDLKTSNPDDPVLVALTLKQLPVSWRRGNRIPIRMQVYYIGEQLLREIQRRDVYELKSRDQLEKRLDSRLQLAHRTTFTTGAVTELLTLRNGSFLITLEVGIPGDETDYSLSVYSSAQCDLIPFQNIFDTSFEQGACNPAARIRLRELNIGLVRCDKDQT